MGIIGIDALDRSIDEANWLLNSLAKDLGEDAHTAYIALCATLKAIRDNIRTPDVSRCSFSPEGLEEVGINNGLSAYYDKDYSRVGRQLSVKIFCTFGF